MKEKVIHIDNVDLRKLKSYLRYGDIKRIAERTGYSENYVWRVLEPGDKRTNRAIIKEAINVVRDDYMHDVPDDLMVA